MKETIKSRHFMLGLVAAGCAMGMIMPPSVSAEVSDADFSALKQQVQKLSQEVQSLQQTNTVQQQTHQKDLEQLQQLKQKLAATQQMTTNVQQQIIAAAQTQPVPRQPIDEASVNHNFMIVGDAEAQYVHTKGQNGAFLLADFAPIFLYRAGNNILFQAGFDTTLQNDTGGGSSSSFDLSFGEIDYVVNNYLTVEAGDILLPLGTYSLRSAGWLNQFPDDPLAVDLLPGAGVGAELEGSIPLGNQGKYVSWQVYGVNGPSSIDGTGNADQLDLGGNVGLQTDNTVANLHGSPVGGARLGIFLPFPYKPHYDLELGISGQSGQWADNHLWSAGVLDASLHLGPAFQVNGEYILTRYGSSNQGMVDQQAWWVQAGYHLSGLNLNLPYLDNVELVGRYGTIHDGLDAPVRRTTVGFIYYITNTLLFEGDYEFVRSSDPSQANELLLQLSLGF